MKLSKLRSLCDKAIETYGDMRIGVYSRDDAFDLTAGSDSYRDLYFRVLLDKDLPGEIVEEEQPALHKSKSEDPTAVLFYE
jgi:hypothetical protein